MSPVTTQPPPFSETCHRPGESERSASIHYAPLGGGLMSYCANAAPGETAPALLKRLVDAAHSCGAHAIQGTVFCDPTDADAKKISNAAATVAGIVAAADTATAADNTAVAGSNANTTAVAGSTTAACNAAAIAGIDFPVACLGRHDTPRGNVLGARITALPAGTFERVKDERGANCGARWETGAARYLLLGALVPRDTGAAREEQAAALWRALKTHIEGNGFAMSNLVRTWFYNDHILDWYAGFNRVRTAFFTEHNIFGTLVPASTGIGASNAAGAALTVDALAIAPKNPAATNADSGFGDRNAGLGGQDSALGKQDSELRTLDSGRGILDSERGSGRDNDQKPDALNSPAPAAKPPLASPSALQPFSPSALSISAVTSPLQCPAYDYKSAFSRAVECIEPAAGGTDVGTGGNAGGNVSTGSNATAAGGLRHLTISGTASIEPGGLTAHIGDLDAQIDLTLRVVGAILESRNMSWSDTARAIIYFPKIEWMPRWHARRAALGLPDLPAIFAHTDICRDDLLFEIELDATAATATTAATAATAACGGKFQIPKSQIPNKSQNSK